jgi:hypothetical protein
MNIRSIGLIVAMLAFAGCCGLKSDRNVFTSKPSGDSMVVPTTRFDEVLTPYLGKTITLRGVVIQGNFSLAICPPDIRNHPYYGVSLYASNRNDIGKEKLRLISSLRKSSSAFVEATGKLYKLGLLDPNGDNSEGDAFFTRCFGHDGNIFWIELADAAPIDDAASIQKR